MIAINVCTKIGKIYRMGKEKAPLGALNGTDLLGCESSLIIA
jgi:hypothetical protein